MAKIIRNNFGNFFVILVIFSLVTGCDVEKKSKQEN